MNEMPSIPYPNDLSFFSSLFSGTFSIDSDGRKVALKRRYDAMGLQRQIVIVSTIDLAAAACPAPCASKAL